MKITRRASMAVTDWRINPELVALRARIAQLDDYLQNARDRLAQHDGTIADATKALERAEVEVLAGRGTDAQLAQVQSRHMGLRRERAREIIAVEDAQAERNKLAATLPTVETQAKQASHDAIQAKGIKLLREMQAAIAALAQAEGDYSALVFDAEAQFPLSINQPHEVEHYDPRFKTRAGFHILRDSRVNGHRRESISVEGATASFAREIDELLEQLAK